MTVFFNVCCFFSHCNAHAASHHLVNDDRPVPWHQSGGDPPLATRLSTPLASSTRDRASDRAGPGCRTESARAYGGFRWLSTVPSRTVSPGHQRLDRPYNNRGGTGACLLSSGVCLCSLLQVCACVFRTRPLLHRFSAGLPGTCHGRRAADSRIEFGTNRSRLASGDRLGCADPFVGSLYGFLRIAYLIFYYGTTLKYTTLKASPICSSHLLICSWMKPSDGLSSTSRRLRFLLPFGRPRRPLAFFLDGSSTTASEGLSTWSVRTG